VDLEKGIPHAVNIKMDNWSHIQEVDYEKLPFKCRACHEYGHFAIDFPKTTPPKKQEEANEKS
jgi:hypothetical protein